MFPQTLQMKILSHTHRGIDIGSNWSNENSRLIQVLPKMWYPDLCPFHFRSMVSWGLGVHAHSTLQSGDQNPCFLLLTCGALCCSHFSSSYSDGRQLRDTAFSQWSGTQLSVRMPVGCEFGRYTWRSSHGADRLPTCANAETGAAGLHEHPAVKLKWWESSLHVVFLCDVSAL